MSKPIGPHGLSHQVGVSDFIQNIVGDLESQTDAAAECVQPGQGPVGPTSDEGAARNGGRDQGAGLQIVEFLELVGGKHAAFGGDVPHLAFNHAGMAGGPGYQDHDLGPQTRLLALSQGLLGQDLKGVGQQRIPRQYGRCFVKGFVAGRFAASQVVIIHGRQIIVNQGIGVDHFQDTSHGHSVFLCVTHGLGRGQA